MTGHVPRVGATPFSLIATCKALGINPDAYLEDVLSRVDTTRGLGAGDDTRVSALSAIEGTVCTLREGQPFPFPAHT